MHSTRFPRATALGLKLVGDGGHEGFDIEEVRDVLEKKAAGLSERFMKTLKDVFCCGHRTWDADHEDKFKRNAEVYCVWASDLEAFLEAGN